VFNSNFVLSYSECQLQLCVVRSDASIGIVSNKPIIASIVSQLSLKMTKHRIDGGTSRAVSIYTMQAKKSDTWLEGS